MPNRTYTPPVADFRTDLDFSFGPDARAAFDTAYRAAFGTDVRIETVDDLELQRQGIDVYLHLTEMREFSDGTILQAGHVLRADEKLRRPPLVLPRPWGDLLLEEYSDWDQKVPGWLGPGKRHDVVAYGSLGLKGECEVRFYWSQRLRELARTNWKSWLERYKRKFAKNGRYVTSSIPVPLNEVEECLVIPS